jgi:transcriptional regulatory protein LevR
MGLHASLTHWLNLDPAESSYDNVDPPIPRIYPGHQLENPIIEDIYTQYANVFNVAMVFINELNKDLDADISKDEIGYVAIYFAASLEKQWANVSTFALLNNRSKLTFSK